MKISKSKQELARIISENGGWRDDAKYSSQDKDGDVNFFTEKPEIKSGWTVWSREFITHNSIYGQNVVKNWHQAVLSRDEFDQIVAEDIVTPENFAGKIDVERVERYLASQESEPAVKPTIEQLAADYRNRKDYANRKQVEADAAKADAEAKLAELVATGKIIGLVVSVSDEEPERKLVITNYHHLHIGDILRCKSVPSGAKCKVGDEGSIKKAENTPLAGGVYVEVSGSDWFGVFGEHWEFVRRP